MGSSQMSKLPECSYYCCRFISITWIFSPGIRDKGIAKKIFPKLPYTSYFLTRGISVECLEIFLSVYRELFNWEKLKSDEKWMERFQKTSTITVWYENHAVLPITLISIFFLLNTNEELKLSVMRLTGCMKTFLSLSRSWKT